MQPLPFDLSEDQFRRLFPFYLLVDAELCFQSWGPSFDKLLPLRQQQAFTDVFELMRPRVPALNYQSLKDLQGQLVLLRLSADPGQVWRGQIEPTSGGQLLFLGTPWFTSMESVMAKGLRLNDFALFDPMVDMLYTLKTQELARNDLQSMHRALSLNTQRLSQLVANLQAGVLVEDEHRNIVLVNQLFCDLFHIPLSPADMAGANCANSAEETKDLFTDPAAFVWRINQVLQDRQLVLNDRLELADGRTFERDFVPLFDGDQYLGHLWQYRDVTEKINADRVLRRKEEKYRRIIANMHLGLMEVDLNDCIRYVNQSFCEMSGYTPEELIGQQAAPLFLAANEQEMLKAKNKTRTQGISDAYELPVTDRHGNARWWLISGAPLFDDGGTLIGSIGIHLDITEHKATHQALVEARDAAEASAKAKQQFLANMSHEIRTPMNAILGLGRQLQKKKGDAEQELFVNTIVTAADNMLVILNDVLDFSKMEAGKLSLEHIPFNLQSFAEKSLLLLQQRADEKGLGLTARFGPGIAPNLIGDPYRLNQILVNIIGNAVKFTEKGNVSLECRLKAEDAGSQQVCFVVKDTGVGIDPQYLPRLFETFSQQEQHTSRRFGGTGLGMSITHQLVQLMNGSISIDSTLNLGTTVTICIPFEKGNTGNQAPNELAVVETATLRGRSVLLVDDNAMNRLVARIVLKAAGMEITEAVNGAEAIEQLESGHFDLVLMDVQMPVMDGLEATRHIRRQMQLPIPVIALTANAIKGENEVCLQAGMNDYLPKPFAEQELLDKMARLLAFSTQHTVAFTTPALLEQTNFDLSQLEAIAGGNAALFSELVQTLATDLEQAASELEAATVQQDRETVRRILHRVLPGVELAKANQLQEQMNTLRKKAAMEAPLAEPAQQVIDTINTLVAELTAKYPVKAN
ncbi:PAS domain S-box-containing protein [Cnuella takakiae]|uniref:PAS domain S-box-containing protein n=1 Tax=Cnuella takakiae TaxID=1302690 RepID=A0A1M5IKU3_9BACT|nr:response regulator [Cnuella takakiae]OLY92215.1 hypothetical protein BUE76_10180 [Cnuella takakiae]SHG28669.1 PAS domain S-box-containing protein [Cnuella takakiae]